jgi:DNA-binding transcriptional ArsR family regulator
VVKRQGTTLDHAFGALSDPTRRAIIASLAEGERTVSEVAAPFAISLPAVSRHLKVLQSAGLVQRAVRGRVHWLSLPSEPSPEMVAWVDRYRGFWARRFDALAEFLDETGNDR